MWSWESFRGRNQYVPVRSCNDTCMSRIPTATISVTGTSRNRYGRDVSPATSTPTGRPRDEELDRAIIRAAAEIMGEDGVEAVTFARVAERAGTSRPALYRRYDNPSDLVVAALGEIAGDERSTPTGDSLADLTQELRSFRNAVQRANSLAVVGSMLASSNDDPAVVAYRKRLVAPRRARIRSILERARSAGALTADDADLELATAMCTGSYYAIALAGGTPARDWPTRMSAAAWRACGGTP